MRRRDLLFSDVIYGLESPCGSKITTFEQTHRCKTGGLFIENLSGGDELKLYEEHPPTTPSLQVC